MKKNSMPYVAALELLCAVIFIVPALGATSPYECGKLLGLTESDAVLKERREAFRQRMHAGVDGLEKEFKAMIQSKLDQSLDLKQMFQGQTIAYWNDIYSFSKKISSDPRLTDEMRKAALSVLSLQKLVLAAVEVKSRHALGSGFGSKEAWELAPDLETAKMNFNSIREAAVAKYGARFPRGAYQQAIELARTWDKEFIRIIQGMHSRFDENYKETEIRFLQENPISVRNLANRLGLSPSYDLMNLYDDVEPIVRTMDSIPTYEEFLLHRFSPPESRELEYWRFIHLHEIIKLGEATEHKSPSTAHPIFHVIRMHDSISDFEEFFNKK